MVVMVVVVMVVMVAVVVVVMVAVVGVEAEVKEVEEQRAEGQHAKIRSVGIRSVRIPFGEGDRRDQVNPEPAFQVTHRDFATISHLLVCVLEWCHDQVRVWQFYRGRVAWWRSGKLNGCAFIKS